MPSFKKLSAFVLVLSLFACVATAAPAKTPTPKKAVTPPSKNGATSKNVALGKNAAADKTGATGAGASAAKCKPRPAAGGAGGKKQAPLKARAVVHPSAKGAITLYHAAKDPMVGGVDLGKTRQFGDFNFGKGALYLTDSWWHAVQYICKAHLSSNDFVNVYEFKWNGAGTKVHEFIEDDAWKKYSAWAKSKGKTADTPRAGTEFKNIMDKSDMISGPMKSATDEMLGIAPDFWQYALLNPAAVSKLVKQHEFKVKCKHILSADASEYKATRPTAEELNQLNNC